MARELQPCGTPAAWQRHRYRKEEPCQPCKEAMRSFYAARMRAYQALAREHAEEFHALFAEEINR